MSEITRGESNAPDATVGGETSGLLDPSIKTELGTSVGKALSLLTAFERAESVGVSELARRAGLQKSTAFRLLSILEEWRLVERNGSRYCLGTRLFELGNRVSYCSPRGLRDVALPFLTELHGLTRETVHLAVLEDTEVLYVEKLYAHNQARTPSYVGGRVPAYCAAVGKAMLTFSDCQRSKKILARPMEPRTPFTLVDPNRFVDELYEVKANGFAIDREEASLGLTCIAAPILNRRGRAVGGVSISGATGRFDPNRYRSTITTVAQEIAKRLPG